MTHESPARHDGRATRREALRAGIFSAVALGLAGCAPRAGSDVAPSVARDPNAPVVLGVSRRLVDGEANPWFTHSSLMCWESLVALNENLEPVPQLAERWSVSDDGLTWRFTLRRGIRFTDGTPFDARAVARNIERNIQITPRPSPFFTMDARTAYGDLASVTPEGDDTVIFRHNRPFPVLEATMSNFFSAMFSPQSFAPNGDFVGIPATTGPFRLVEWERDQTATTVRNENYWGPAPRVREIRWRQIPDANTRVSALIAGQLDAVVELGAIAPAQYQQLQGRTDIRVGADPITIGQFLFFHCGKPPFNDVRLRQAVSRAINREQIVQSLWAGLGVTNTGLLSSLSRRWFSPKGVVPYAPAEATRLAQQVLGGQRVTVDFPFNATAGNARSHKETVEYLQVALRPLGFDIRPIAVESGVLTDMVNRGEWNLRLTNGHGWANGDPDFRLRTFMHSRGSANTTQQGSYRNETVDRLIDQGVAEADRARRFAIYERLQEIAVEEAPVMCVYDELSPYASRATIRDLRQRVTYQPTLETMNVG